MGETTHAENAPDATVEVHVEPPVEPNDGDTTVVVVDGGAGDDGGHDIELDHEHRITALEHELAELRTRFIVDTPSREEVDAIVDEAVADAAVVAEIVAEDVAEDVSEEVAEVVAEDVAEDVSPHKTHWLERTFGEWTGRNGSGKGSK